MKKILLLGGSRYLRPVIKAIHEMGYYAITCDYLPDNYAHKISDEYYNVSIVDRDAVLDLARKLSIDGIMSFACDPGVVTAAYVAEKLGLPTLPYESVKIMQNKALFRKFLTDNGFNVPKAKGYTSVEEALNDVDNFDWPVIVKPTDSAGSKGATRVDEPKRLEDAISNALKYSFSGEFIIEEFIEKKGDSSDTDCFSIDGNLVFASFNNQKFDINAGNPYVPCVFTWPSEMPQSVQTDLCSELQRMMRLLKLNTSIYNIETRLGVNGKSYIMECSPRGGGNRLAEVLEYATGQEIIKNAVRAAVGDSVVPMAEPVYDGYWAEIILHSCEDGVFERLDLDECILGHLYQKDLWVEPGEMVHSFTAANHAIGTLILNFASKDELEILLSNVYDHARIILRKKT